MQSILIICLKVSLIASALFVVVNLLFNRHEHFEDTEEFLNAMEPDENSYS